MAGEDAVLLGNGEPAEERQDLGVSQSEILEGVDGIANLSLATAEHQDIAGSLDGQLLDCITDRLVLIPRLRDRRINERPVPDFDRVCATSDLHDGRTIEMVRETFGVDGRGCDDDLEVRPSRQELPDVAEQEVDVERALMCFVDDDRVVGPEVSITVDLVEENPIGHHLDPRGFIDGVGEANLESHEVTDPGSELLGNPLGDRPCGDSPRLRVPDHSRRAPPQLKAQLGELGALAGAGFAGNDHDLVVGDGAQQFLAPGGDGEILRVGDLVRVGAAGVGG